MTSIKRQIGRKNKEFIIQCPFCKDKDKREIHLKGKYVNEHLIVIKDSSNHIHVHGPIKNEELIKRFILAIGKESEIEIEDEDEE